jgi:pantetheine-phosphate adenylyltransferase
MRERSSKKESSMLDHVRAAGVGSEALTHSLPPPDTTVVYAGTFDPFTKGHLDVAVQAGRMFGRVIIAIGVNPSKTCMFTPEERKLLIERELTGVPGNFEVETFRGLLAHYAQTKQATALIRGVRNITDFASEIQLASVNREQSGRTELSTLFCPPRREFEFVSSSAAKELLRNDGDVMNYVSPHVEVAMRMKKRGDNVMSFLSQGDSVALPIDVAREIVLGRWMRLARSLGMAESYAVGVGNSILAAYQEPHRHYHNLEHIAEGLLAMDGFAKHIQDKNAFALGWMFHDVVYDPASTVKGENERNSVAALEGFLRDASIPWDLVQRARRLIELTIDHETSQGDNDGGYFIDNDLWILGAPQKRYLRYSEQVRAEYSAYDDVTWAARRIKFLESMAVKPRVFSTERFQYLFGDQIASNSQAEIARLVWGRVTAVTGSIGAGKSSVMTELESLGFVCESADQISRALGKCGTDTHDAIIAHFGKRVVGLNGELDRRALRGIVFEDPAEREALEKILHPAIEARAFELFKAHVVQGKLRIAYELPLLFEAGLQHTGFNCIVTVDAKEDLRVERVMARDRCSRHDAEAVLSAQMPASEKIRFSNVVIRNDGDPQQLREEIMRILPGIQ